MHGLFPIAHDGSIEFEDAQAELAVDGSGLVGDDVDGEASVLNMGRDEHRTVEAARVVLEGLPASVVVDARPGGDRPAVIQLPEDGAHGAGAAAAEMLGSDLDAFGLKDLTDVEE